MNTDCMIEIFQITHPFGNQITGTMHYRATLYRDQKCNTYGIQEETYRYSEKDGIIEEPPPLQFAIREWFLLDDCDYIGDAIAALVSAKRRRQLAFNRAIKKFGC